MYWDNPEEFAKAILDDLEASGFVNRNRLIELPLGEADERRSEAN